MNIDQSCDPSFAKQYLQTTSTEIFTLSSASLFITKNDQLYSQIDQHAIHRSIFKLCIILWLPICSVSYLGQSGILNSL